MAHQLVRQSLYQKFAFIKYIINSSEFKDSVHRIVTAPVTKWTDSYEEKDVRSVRRFTNTNVKELVKGGKRTNLPSGHYLENYGLKMVPTTSNSPFDITRFSFNDDNTKPRLELVYVVP